MRWAGSIDLKGHLLTTERVERRLAAVLAADVAGYSRLMGIDEEGTLARLKAVRKALVDPTIAEHRGVSSKQRATACWWSSPAPWMQRGVRSRSNAAWPSKMPTCRRIAGSTFRIGIHVGDIIIDENDIFGDGVNVAARARKCSAEPGGVCVSGERLRANQR